MSVPEDLPPPGAIDCPMQRRLEEGDCPVIPEWHAVLAVKAVHAALRAVLRESAAPSPDGCAAAR
jgi:hypothetical protein